MLIADLSHKLKLNIHAHHTLLSDYQQQHSPEIDGCAQFQGRGKLPAWPRSMTDDFSQAEL